MTSWLNDENEWELQLLRNQLIEATTSYVRTIDDQDVPLSLASPFLSSWIDQSMINMNNPLTTSASCPSFTSMLDHELFAEMNNDMPIVEDGAVDCLNNLPLGSYQQETLRRRRRHRAELLYDNSMEIPSLFVRQEIQRNSKAGYNGLDSQHLSEKFRQRNMRVRAVESAYGGIRPGLHGSASFTSLSSMEAEYRRQCIRKRRKEVEQWRRQNRLKGLSKISCLSTRATCPSGELTESLEDERSFSVSQKEENEMVGFSIDDFPTDSTSDAQWPVTNTSSCMQSFVAFESKPSENLLSMTSIPSSVPHATPSTSIVPQEETDNVPLLLNVVDYHEQEADHTQPSACRSSIKCTAAIEKEIRPQKAKKIVSANAKSPAKVEDNSCLSRIKRILEPKLRPNALTYIELSTLERTLIEKSSLLTIDKIVTSAGSLWLFLHSATCKQVCGIQGCEMMRRVVHHCLSCEEKLGDCKQTCNEAKILLLHYGSCGSQRENCNLCSKLLEIDATHRAIDQGLTTSRDPTSLGSHHSHDNTSSESKFIPILPNPYSHNLFPIHNIPSIVPCGYPLAAYLEQTSPLFNAEIQMRISKRVSAAVSKDLIQHMHKKTRLRTLQEVQADARKSVLCEMEHELHVHMQANNAWATMNFCCTPPYLVSLAAASFACYTHPTTLTEEMVSIPKPIPGGKGMMQYEQEANFCVP